MVAKITAVLVSVALVFFLMLSGSVVEFLGAGELMVIQAPTSGQLRWYTQPGVYWQGFGKVTTYKKRFSYEFNTAKIVFNDGGGAALKGSIQVDMPSDEKNLNALHTRYGSQAAIENDVVQKVVDKVLYMTGPLMSSRESYAEKRTDLIRYVQDQIDNGVYRVETQTTETLDEITNQRRTTVVARVALGQNGVPQRQEASVVGEFGLRAFNFAITDIAYDERVQKQISQQQQIIMDIQTSVAEARKAEQRRITTEQEGQANAARAKWEQETEKAKAIVQAEQQRDVARLAAEAAKAYKEEQYLRADADSTYKRQVMAADGALAQKLTTFKEVNAMWAAAFENYKGQLVPTIAMGAAGGGANGAASAQALMDLLMAKTAKDLSVDIGVK
jgi:regulator of protease activity HflC (stomatin/prohibitin superfamily)